MTNIHKYELPNSNALSKALLISGLMSTAIAGHGLATAYHSSNDTPNESTLTGKHYWTGGVIPTHSRHTSISGEYNLVSQRFEDVMGNFYARLLEKQQPLGEVFERVLHENLWSLYES